MSNGKIVFKSNFNFGLWACTDDNECGHDEDPGNGYEPNGEIYTERYAEPGFHKIKSKTTGVCGITWKVVGLIKYESGVWTGDEGAHHQICGHTLKLSLAASEIPDGQECDVSGRFTVGTELNGKELKTFLFSRTFSSTNPDFLGDIEEMDIFKDLKIKSKEDRIIVKVEFTVEPLRDVRKWTRNDTIMVNGQEVEVNKNLLALHSGYFKTYNEIKELPPPTTVDDFKLLLDILDGKRNLDDDCIENVFCLAKTFAFEELEAKCRTFLIEDSKKSAFFKYRLADKFDLIVLRAFILTNMTEQDLDEEFLNDPDYEKLDEASKAAILDRKADIYDDNMEEEECTSVESESESDV